MTEEQQAQLEGETTYDMNAIDVSRLDAAFTYHAPKGDQAMRYAFIRTMARDLAKVVLTRCPMTRERALALTKIEEAVMWANASIARGE